jgi:hypothetical protein
MGSASSTILSWITAEVNQALARVRERIGRFSAGPEDASVLVPCPDHLHQVSGALRMVGLAGATRFCEEIEAGFGNVEHERPSAASIGVLDRAVLALKVIAAVQTCTLPEPSAMNSAASRQLVIPPMPEIAKPAISGSRAISATMFSAIGLTDGPQ